MPRSSATIGVVRCFLWAGIAPDGPQDSRKWQRSLDSFHSLHLQHRTFGNLQPSCANSDALHYRQLVAED